jgi:hypothetical protein
VPTGAAAVRDFPIPGGFEATVDVPFPLHHPSHQIVEMHFVVSKVGKDCPRTFWKQLAAYVLRWRFRRAVLCQERGSRENHLHYHLLIAVLMKKTETMRLMLMKQIQGWLHGGGEAEERELCRYRDGYRFSCAWLEPTQPWRKLQGYFQKFHGGDFKLEAVGDTESQLQHFEGVRERLMAKARRPGKTTSRSAFSDNRYKFSNAHFPCLPWLRVDQEARFMVICPTSEHFLPTNEFTMDGSQHNPIASQHVANWDKMPEQDLHNITIHAIRYVFFRSAVDRPLKLDCARDLQEGVWPVPLKGPYYDRYGPEKEDYDTMSYAEARRINDTIAGLRTATTRDLGAGLSTGTLTYDGLLHRHNNDQALVEGDPSQDGISRYPQAATDTGSGSGGSSTGNAGIDDTNQTSILQLAMQTEGGPGVDDEDQPAPVRQLDLPFLDRYLNHTAVVTFRCQFTADPRPRRSVPLAIAGNTGTGKTEFACSMFSNPHVATTLDFATYDFRTHDCIVLNDVIGIAQIMLDNKELFQSPDRMVTINSSKTMMYSRRLRVANKPIIITLNTDTDDWKQMERSDWINANCEIMVVPPGDLMFEGDADPNTLRRRQAWAAAATAGATDQELERLLGDTQGTGGALAGAAVAGATGRQAHAMTVEWHGQLHGHSTGCSGSGSNGP